MKDCGSFRVWLVLALMAVLSSGAFAQTDTAQISGFVKDTTEAVVPNATVVLRNEATGLERRTTTNESGYYVVSSLPPGYYTLTAEAPGFKRYVKTQNKLDPSINTTVDAVLSVGEVSETVEVVAQAAAVQSETATVGKLVEGAQIKNMMLNGRNPLFLALLKPGVRGSSLAGFSFGLTNAGLNVNGSRSQDNVITFDGAVAIRTRANGTSVGTADLETVQEVQILTANYGAEYGRTNGGQIRMVTKSGTRDFHGTAYEYFRNNVLDANTWSRNRAGQNPDGSPKQPREARKFNQFGYNVSGPVFIPGKWNADRSKLFFLWSQEWVRFRREITSIQTVPSLPMRQGDFSELLNPSNTFFGKVRVVNDPTTGAPFANNVIPPSSTSPNGLGFLRSYPEPTAGFQQGTNNFIQTRPQPEDQRKDTVSADYMPTEKHTFRVRFQHYSWVSVDAFRTGFDRAVTDWSRPNMTGSVNYIWTVSPTMVNEFLATGSVDRVYIGVYQPGERWARDQYGIDYPYIFPERKEIYNKIPTVRINNFGTIDGGPYPAKSAGPIYQFADNLTKIVGSHTLKFGLMFERSGQNDFDQINVTGVPGGTNNQNGAFAFTDGRANGTGLAIGNAAMGLFDTYAEIGQRAYTPYRSHMFEWFVQDSWKATQKLRLEFGVRWTWMTPYYYSLWRNMAVFDPDSYDPAKAVVQDPKTGNVLSGDRFNGVLIPGDGWPDAAYGRVGIADSGAYDYLFSGGSKYWGENQYANFQPRLGLAYQITPKTVVRTGAGRFYLRTGVRDNIFLGGNPPFQPMVSLANGQADDPGGGAQANFPQFFMTQDPVYKIPSSWMWNATVGREIGYNTVVEVGYVGRAGLHLERTRELNQLQPGTLHDPANKGLNVNYLRPYKGFAFINMGENAARSIYHGLQIDVTRRFSNGLGFGVAYTYSQSKDNSSGLREQPYNSYDDRSWWGISGFDRTHVAVVNFIYQLPFYRDQQGVTGKILGGWSLTGIMQFETGGPFTVTTGDDFAGIGSGNLAMPWQQNGELVYTNEFAPEGRYSPGFYFQPTNPDGSAVFTKPPLGTFANQTKNLFRHPGGQSWNIGIYKDFLITETHTLQFRAEGFNWINHPNWSTVDTTPTSATFGKVSSKTSERNVQLVLRYMF